MEQAIEVASMASIHRTPGPLGATDQDLPECAGDIDAAVSSEIESAIGRRILQFLDVDGVVGGLERVRSPPALGMIEIEAAGFSREVAADERRERHFALDMREQISAIRLIDVGLEDDGAEVAHFASRHRERAQYHIRVCGEENMRITRIHGR